MCAIIWKKRTPIFKKGNILHAEVHAANIHDPTSGILALRGAYEKFPSLTGICAAAGYRGTFESEVAYIQISHIHALLKRLSKTM